VGEITELRPEDPWPRPPAPAGCAMLGDRAYAT